MLSRPRYFGDLVALMASFPVVGILGARQVGKTSLARTLAGGSGTFWFDLESPFDLAKFQVPELLLAPLTGRVIIDEVQAAPNLFPLLRVLADRPGSPAQFLILGSAAPELLRQGSETLAGRVGFLYLDGFDLAEVGAKHWPALWTRGGFPRSFLATSEPESLLWREQFVDTFLSRDLPALGVPVPPTTMRRFWSMLAHWHGQTWNGSELGRSFAMSDTTMRRYLDTLEAAFVVRVLQPWHENLSKRQVKAPKVYVRDSGLLHTLLGIRDHAALTGHPKLGASWEGFALGQVIRQIGAQRHECYFWATHQGAELDLLVVRGQRRLGFEFKYTGAPTRTKSMDIACRDLRLDSLTVVIPGSANWPMGVHISVLGIEDLAALPVLG